MASPGLGMDGDAAGSAGAKALAEGHPQATVEEYIRIFEAHKSGEGGSSATSVLGSLLENETDGEILKCFHGEAGAWDEQKKLFKGPPQWEVVLRRLRDVVMPAVADHPDNPGSTANTSAAKVKKGSPASYKRQVSWSSLLPASTCACARVHVCTWLLYARP